MVTLREGCWCACEKSVCVSVCQTQNGNSMVKWDESFQTWGKKKAKSNTGGEERYFQVNSQHCNHHFGLQTDPKFCRCKVTTFPSSSILPLSLAHSLSPSPALQPPCAGKHSGGQRRAECQMCQVTAAQSGSKSRRSRRGSLLCVCVCVLVLVCLCLCVSRKTDESFFFLERTEHTQAAIWRSHSYSYGTKTQTTNGNFLTFSRILFKQTFYDYKSKHCHWLFPTLMTFYIQLQQC